MKKLISIFAFFVMFTSVVYSQEVDNAYTKVLSRMFEVSGSEVAFSTAITQMIVLQKQQHPEISQEIWAELEKGLLTASLQSLVDMLAPVYSKYLTKKDLEKVIKFYETPVGKKYAKYTPDIMKESMQVGQQWGMKVGQEIMQKIKEKTN